MKQNHINHHCLKAMMLLLFVTSAMPVLGNTEDKAFKQALADGRKPGQPYYMQFTYGELATRIYDFKEYCKTHDYVFIDCGKHTFTIEYGNSVIPPDKKTCAWCEFVPSDEYEQYKQELDIVENGGMLDYTKTVASIPTDLKSLNQANALYKKAQKAPAHKAFELYHQAGLLGNPMAKIMEARFHCYWGNHAVRVVPRNKKRATQLADEALISDDPEVWETAKGIMSADGEAYVRWKKGETEEFPYRYLRQYKGKDVTLQIMREKFKYNYNYSEPAVQALVNSAEDGDAKAQKDLAMCLWHGLKTTPNKQEAVKWMRMIVSPDTEIHDYLIIAKGENIYDEEIPDKWYNHSHTKLLAEAASAGNQEAKRAVEANRQTEVGTIQAVGLLMGLAYVASGAWANGLDNIEKIATSTSSKEKEKDVSNSKPDIDYEKIVIPKHHFATEWLKGVFFIEGVDNEKLENQWRSVVFEDDKQTSGKIHRVYGQKGYYVDGKRYKTEEDAIGALYVHEKYGVFRETGRWRSFEEY